MPCTVHQKTHVAFGACPICAIVDAQGPDPKDARIAELEAALAKAEEALGGAPCSWTHAPECSRCAALAAIRETRQ